MRLRDSGQKDAAYRLLTEIQTEGNAYPPAMMALANLMRERGELSSARSLLEVLEKLAPTEPAVMFNLAGLWVQLHDLPRARGYLQRLLELGVPAEMADIVERFDRSLTASDLILSPQRAADGLRAKEDAHFIDPGLLLRRAVEAMPLQWLNAAARANGVERVPRRPQREAALVRALLDPARLRRTVVSLPPEARAALAFTLNQGGWCKLQLLTRRFGPQEGDGFFWVEDPPVSTIGQLRVRALLFVGRSYLDGRRYQVAVIPSDLRPILAQWLDPNSATGLAVD